MRTRHLVILVLAVASLSACSYSRQVHRRSDLMSYLYPQSTEAPAPRPDAVTLQLPLRLGIAFVPPTGTNRCGFCPPSIGVTAQQEKTLLEVVKKAFEGRDWVERVAIIPTAYLRPGGGFTNLQQVAALNQVDVVALVSIDQFQSSHPEKISFLYLTVIGAYVLPLDQHDTRTLIDAAVFHAPSRTFLLRAPGHSHVKGHAAMVDLNRDLGERANHGLKLAMADLAKNLDLEIESFKEEVRTGARADVEIVTSRGESVRSGGSSGALGALGAVVMLGLALWRRRGRS